MLVRRRGPRKNMFPPVWLQARATIRGSNAAVPAEVHLLVALLERGGESLGQLQELADSPALIPIRDDEMWPALLEFIEYDLTDLFRSAAVGAATLIRGASRSDDCDPAEVKADIACLGRYLVLACHATEHPTVPAQVRRAFEAVGLEMNGWSATTTRVIEEIERRYDAGRETADA